MSIKNIHFMKKLISFISTGSVVIKEHIDANDISLKSINQSNGDFRTNVDSNGVKIKYKDNAILDVNKDNISFNTKTFFSKKDQSIPSEFKSNLDSCSIAISPNDNSNKRIEIGSNKGDMFIYSKINDNKIMYSSDKKMFINYKTTITPFNDDSVPLELKTKKDKNSSIALSPDNNSDKRVEYGSNKDGNMFIYTKQLDKSIIYNEGDKVVINSSTLKINSNDIKDKNDKSFLFPEQVSLDIDGSKWYGIKTGKHISIGFNVSIKKDDTKEINFDFGYEHKEDVVAIITGGSYGIEIHTNKIKINNNEDSDRTFHVILTGKVKG